ncbi:MAG: class I SAM-dependent methyltransferase [Candidatus Daviesbacteria bacterium]|nr:class I SAM-dependent methyltransferase [Candidatus Daviesbacteria bacterium]
MERFSYEWVKFNKIVPDYEIQFLKWIHIFKPEDFKDKRILDAGCGMGRNSYWPLLYGAKEVVAFDHDHNIVNVARKNLSNFKNVKIYYQSIYRIIYKDYFDIAFSIGVIHHLQYPQKAITNLINSVKKNGTVLIWVYDKEGSKRIVEIVNFLRYFTSRLPLQIVDVLSYLITVFLWVYLKIIMQTHPYFQQISNFNFWHLRSIVFDQLIPKIANYWSREEVLALFKDKRLKNIKIFKVNNNSWTVTAQKK